MTIARDTLKAIATLTMVADHVGAVFFPDQLAWRIVGRVSYPLFLLLLLDGLQRTKSKRVMELRLCAFALLAEFPHWWCFGTGGNVIAGFAVAVYCTRRGPWLTLCAAFVLEYGGFQYGWTTVLAFVLPSVPIRWLAVTLSLIQRTRGAWAGLGAAWLPLVHVTPGKRWFPAWLSATFYPAHLVVLALVKVSFM